MIRKIPLAAISAIVLAAPISANEVNVYSYRQPALVSPLFEAFTEETGIAVNVNFLNTGMVERLKAEGKRSPADIVLTVDISRLSEIVNNDLAQPVSSDVLMSTIPAKYRGPNSNWFALTLRARIVYASIDRVADGEVTTYEDLALPKWKGRICTRSGTHAYNLALLSAVIAHHGAESAKAWLTGVKSNLARKPQGNDRAQVKAIWAGECDISVGNTYYMGAMLMDPEQRAWADSVRIVFPEFEDGGTHVNVSGIAMTKHAPNHGNALKLMEFLASPKAQKIYAEANFEYPVESNSLASETVKSWGDFTRDGVSLAEIASFRPTALRLVQEVDFDN
ncbi:MAG: Fe(3+) ABC transporter substrate-binding protein [Albidovulum sp.]|nr:Fe(3+) ABC transporter substrate-binding protein [Albidovulum sp.]MDE0308176.1 Fe(3+) ABC transporter substrate-binding protein [Albidovulum sp.]MDE0532939.1 Fe(3+) ABC transporter substrate-binding protein [Albidovulum sp.]